MRHRASLYTTVAFCTGCALAVAWGWIDAGGLRGDLPGHATAVIAGGIGLLLGLPVLASSLSLARRIRALRAAPEGRWTVTPAQVAALLEYERRTGEENEWRPTRRERTHGIEVLWAGEHLVAGGHYWRVAPEMYPAIKSVRAHLAPPSSVALYYRQLWSPPLSSHQRLIVTERRFAVPAPDESQARAFSRHFNGVLADPHPERRQERFRRYSRWVFGLAAVFFAMLLFGFGVAWHDNTYGIHRQDDERAALILITVLGVMGTPMALMLAVALRKPPGG